MNWQPRIRTILLLVNIVMLIIMLGGFNLLRGFETSLIRQTETELNTQAIFIAALYKAFYAQQKGQSISAPLRYSEAEVEWKPLNNNLNIATSVLLEEQPAPVIYSGKAVDKDEQIVGRMLIRILQEVQIQTLASIRVVNKQGVVISSTNLTENVSLLNRPEVVLALDGEHQAVLRKRKLTHKAPSAYSISRGENFRVHITHPVKYKGKVIAAVVLSRTPESLTQLLGRYKIEIAGYITFVLLLVWLISSFTSFTINKPIVAVMKQANRAKNGEKGAVTPLKHPGSLEVMQLSSSVADMAKALEQRSDYIMEFLSHVSHELKTPVTAIQGAVELLIDHNETMSGEQQQRFLSNLQQDGIRIEQLVQRLLTLAKADLKKNSNEFTDPVKSINHVIMSFTDRKASISWNNSPELKLNASNNLAMDQDSFECIIRNLIENAIQASATEIILNTEIINLNKAALYYIHVSDNGDNISDANINNIFKPFFTTRRETGGTGLGLSIIKSLLRAQGGSIELHVSHQTLQTKTFTVMIPVYTGKS